MELLQTYTRVRDMDTEVDAVRHMINGLEVWLTQRLAQTSQGSDVEPKEPITTAEADSEMTSPSLEDFGGMPNIGLPGAGTTEDRS